MSLSLICDLCDKKAEGLELPVSLGFDSGLLITVTFEMNGKSFDMCRSCLAKELHALAVQLDQTEPLVCRQRNEVNKISKPDQESEKKF
jgi:hypothetical protein